MAMSNLPIDYLRDCGIPVRYMKTTVSLSTTTDLLGTKLFDLLDPEKPGELKSALHNHFWLMVGNSANMRECLILTARAFALMHKDVLFCSGYELLRLLQKDAHDEEETSFLHRARTCDILVFDDFHDDSYQEQWTTAKLPLLVMLRRRIERNLVTISQSTKDLNGITSWPKSFMDYLGHHIFYLPEKGIRKQ